MHRLLTIGFESAGHWSIVDDALTLELARFGSQSNILYAFCVDGEVKYVGKTTQALKSRFYGYLKPGPTQTTNVRNNRLIREHLANGAAVDILALPDNGLMHYGVFHLNLAAGLEDSIIAVLNPEWNGSRTALPEPTPPSEPQPVLADFEFTLQKTYYNMGFFNVSVNHESVFASDGDQIEIFLGNSPTPTVGTINRRCNTNNTPRIMGSTPLRDWFQANGTLMGRVRVVVHTPNEIRMQIPT